MRKLFLALILISLHSLLFANDGDTLGHQIKKKFLVSPGGETLWGLIHYPSTFFLSNQTYPLIVFNHGASEIDVNGTDTLLTRLNKFGPGFFLSTQNWNMAVTSPMTGRTHEFLYFALQAKEGLPKDLPTASPTVDQVMYVINNDPVLKDRIDRNGIFITGTSAGGGRALEFTLRSREVAGSIAAIVPMSTFASINFFADFTIAEESRIPVWAFHGLLDSTCYASSTTQPFIERMNAISPNLGRWTKLPLRHSGWNTYYSPTYREPIDGIQMNIYEWMLYHLKNAQTLLATTIESFAARVLNGATLLDWRTSSETDNQKFIIERSEDGQNFIEVGEVPTKATNGNSTQSINYQFTYKFN